MRRVELIRLCAGLLLGHALATNGETVRFLDNYDITQDLADVVHLGDQNLDIFYRPANQGASRTWQFDLKGAPQATATGRIHIAHYQSSPGYQNAVRLNGTSVAYLGPSNDAHWFAEDILFNAALLKTAGNALEIRMGKVGSNDDDVEFTDLYLQTATFRIWQVTDRGGGGGPCDTCCQLIHRQPTLNPRGDQFTFASTWNVDDAAGNPNTNRHTEVFHYDLATETFTQVTQTEEGISVPFDFAANAISFLSSSPELPGNEDRNADLFLVDPASLETLQTMTVSTGPTAIDHGLAETCPFPWFGTEDWATLANLHADLSDDGGFCVWASNRNIPSEETAEGSNADENYEIYLRDVSTAVTRQLTETTGGDAEAPSAGANLWPKVAAGGNGVVFVSNRDLDGPPVTEGRHGLFWIDGTGSPKRLTSAEVVVEREFPAFGMDDAGTRVVFASDVDLTGGNPDGNTEIFAVALPSGAVTQITDTADEMVNSRPILSGDGLKLAFLSNADLGGFGQNADGSQELWMFHFDEDGNYVDPFVQVTDLPETANPTKNRTHWMDWFSMDRDGSHLVMCTNADLTGANTEHAYEIFLATFDWDPAALNITKINRTVEGKVELHWECEVSPRQFTVESSSSLLSGSWEPVPPAEQWPVDSTTWTSPEPIVDNQMYFRVRGE
ncbi:MAG: hypothetical protein H7A46_24650 [Verrucomicrobiales bacterium]|nr:hypothetical protein [Verrucomicrobiales bacterium]